MSDSIKVISFNVNGIRARLHQLEHVLKLHKPDVIGLQEIKVSDEDWSVLAISISCVSALTCIVFLLSLIHI